jgi:biopolymer transport protein ExbD
MLGHATSPLPSSPRASGYIDSIAARIIERAAGRVKYDSVAKVLALAQRSRMKKIGFVDTAEFKD